MKTSAIPLSLKIAIFLFVIHIALYAEGIWQAYSKGLPLHPLWFFHLFASSYMGYTIQRRKAGLHRTIVAYCVIISVVMLRNDYLALAENDNLLSAMSPAIIMFAPLLLAAVAVIMGRKYYPASTPASGDSAQPNA